MKKTFWILKRRHSCIDDAEEYLSMSGTPVLYTTRVKAREALKEIKRISFYPTNYTAEKVVLNLGLTIDMDKILGNN